MKKLFVILLIFMFISMSINASTIGINKEKTTITTTSSRGYIQDLIDNASIGDTIYIPSGVYYENIVIDKSINLIGEDRETTIIDGGGSGNVVHVSADWVNISGFSIINSGIYNGGAGIYFDYPANNCSVTDSNISLNNGFGIIMDYGHNNYIYNNLICSNYKGAIQMGSIGSIITNNIINFNGEGAYEGEEGISLVWCGGCTISDNILNENGIGMYECGGVVVDNNVISNSYCGLSIGVGWGFGDCIFSNNSFFNSGVYISFFDEFEDNIFSNNTVNDKPLVYLEDESDIFVEDEVGQVILKDCDNITIQNQELCNTTIGILFEKSNNCLISNNTISSNLGGIEFVDSNNNIITGNKISNNFGEDPYYPLGGIRFIFNYIGNSNNIISDNIIYDNSVGFSSLYESSDNIFYHNNFFENTDNAYDDGDNIWDDGYPSGGNFWDDYTGEDNDGDGIGD